MVVYQPLLAIIQDLVDHHHQDIIFTWAVILVHQLLDNLDNILIMEDMVVVLQIDIFLLLITFLLWKVAGLDLLMVKRV
jgi:hypothetical protein